MLESASILLALAICFSMTGVGLSRSLLKISDFKSCSFIAGASLIILALCWLLYLEADLTLSLYIAFAFGSLNLVRSIFFKNRRRQSLKEIKNWLIALCLGLAVSAICLKEGRPTTPLHSGVDMAGYSITANFLGRNVKISELKSKLMRETHSPNYDEAKKNNNLALSFETEVASEFILKALRWGVPLLNHFVQKLFGSSHPTNVLFLIAVLFFAATPLFIFNAFPELRPSLYLPIMLSTIFNVNFINTLYQGQLAQIIGMPFFIVSFALVFRWRERRAQGGEILFLALSLGAMTVIYNELVFTLCLILGCTSILDLIFRSNLNQFKNWILSFSLSLALGLLVSYPISSVWFGFILKHLKNIRIGGWPQPLWMNPAEALGLKNIFSPFTNFEQSRGFFGLFVSTILSLIICALISNFLKRRLQKAPYVTTLMSMILFCLAVFAKNLFVEKIHNYQYTKAVTYFLPFFLALILLSFSYLKKGTAAAWVFSLAIVLNGIYLLKDFSNDIRVVTKEDLALKPFEEKMKELAIFVPRPAVFTFMHAAIVDLNWINRNGLPLKAPQRPMPLAIFFDKVANPDLTLRPNLEVVFENTSFAIVKTKLSTKDISQQDGAIDFGKAIQMPIVQAEVLDLMKPTSK